MILPQALLNTLEYYEETTIEKDRVFYTRFTLHFKQWWKLKKVIMIRWRTTKINQNTDTRTWQEPDNAADLRAQLEKHFGTNTKGWEATL